MPCGQVTWRSHVNERYDVEGGTWAEDAMCTSHTIFACMCDYMWWSVKAEEYQTIRIKIDG